MAHTDIEQLLDQALGDAANDSSSARPEVLVVDDDESVGDALGLVLADTYTVVSATSGDQGINLLHKRTMAVVLDVRMRIKDGFDTFVEMKKKSPDVPILFHSAYQDVRDPYEVMNELRPFAYIKKGDDGQLRQALAEAVAFYQDILSSEDLAKHLEERNAELTRLEAKCEEELATVEKELSSHPPTGPVTD